ncbi:MAG: hypothetical protein ACJZ1Y_07820 [Candidatus Neomarinimicrobiota bacterium]
MLIAICAMLRLLTICFRVFFRRYSNGQRITRKYLENDENEAEVLDQMTELGKGSYIDFMENLGLPVKDLDSLYHDELDDPWKIEVIYEKC